MSARRFQVRTHLPHPRAAETHLVYDAHDDGPQLAACNDRWIALAIAQALNANPEGIDAVRDHEGKF